MNASLQRRRRLADEVRRYDGTMRRLADPGIDLRRPGRELLADLQARHDERRRQHETLRETQREADQRLLPELLALYRHGDDAERQWLRDLLKRNPTFRWGFGWGLAARLTTVEAAAEALAVLSMKDGGSDWRDQIVALDHLCAAMQRAGLPVAALLAEAAAWSSDLANFPGARPTRALLLDYAARFTP